MRVLLALFVCLSLSAAVRADLIISEYVEGSSNNKAIELFNTGSASIDLSLVGLQIFFNGSSTATNTINTGTLTGTLAPGQVFTIANTNWDSPTLGGILNFQTGSLNFNGNDAIALLLNSTIVDVIGQIGTNPGTEWGTLLQSTADNTLTRNVDILTGDADGSNVFDPTIQWRGGAQNSHTLGVHDGNFTAVPEPAIVPVFLGLLGVVSFARRRGKSSSGHR